MSQQNKMQFQTQPRESFGAPQTQAQPEGGITGSSSSSDMAFSGGRVYPPQRQYPPPAQYPPPNQYPPSPNQYPPQSNQYSQYPPNQYSQYLPQYPAAGGHYPPPGLGQYPSPGQYPPTGQYSSAQHGLWNYQQNQYPSQSMADPQQYFNPQFQSQFKTKEKMAFLFHQQQQIMAEKQQKQKMKLQVHHHEAGQTSSQEPVASSTSSSSSSSSHMHLGVSSSPAAAATATAVRDSTTISTFVPRQVVKFKVTQKDKSPVLKKKHSRFGPPLQNVSAKKHKKAGKLKQFKKSASSWPLALQDYVEKLFKVNTGQYKTKAEVWLKNKIQDLNKNNNSPIDGVWSIDWTKEKCPNFKSTEVLQKMQQNGLSPMGKKSKNKKVPEFKIAQQTSAMLQKRKKRFSLTAAQKRPRRRVNRVMPSKSSSSSGLHDINLDDLKIVGTCETLEKQYLRLTSAPDPETVRPERVLVKSLELLKSKWQKDRDYNAAIDAFKSIRQDMTVQHIKNKFTVTVYELNSRVCLEMGDLSEFNQCQTQLKELYEDNASLRENYDEFNALRMLYYIVTKNSSSMLKMTQETSQTGAGEHLLKAMKLREAVSRKNYHLFFKLYQEFPESAQYLLDNILFKVRYQALQIICKAYLSFPLEDLRDEILFDDERDGDFSDYLESSGVVLKQSGSVVDCRKCKVKFYKPEQDSDSKKGVTHGSFQ